MSQGRFREEGLRITLYRFNATKKGILPKPVNFQVPPLEEFGWSQTANHGEFDTLSRGQFSRRGGRSLLTFEFRTLAVDYQPRWVAWHQASPDAPHPQQTANMLKQLVRVGTPFMFHARSGYWEGSDLRLPVTLRSVHSSEQAGEVDARYFDLSFVEWREQELDRRGRSKKRRRHALPTTVEIFEDGSIAEVAEEGGQPKKIHTTNPDWGDLQDLARHFYGDPTFWRAISRENGISDFAPTRNLAELKKKGRRIRKLRIPDLADPATGGVEAPV